MAASQTPVERAGGRRVPGNAVAIRLLTSQVCGCREPRPRSSDAHPVLVGLSGPRCLLKGSAQLKILPDFWHAQADPSRMPGSDCHRRHRPAPGPGPARPSGSLNAFQPRSLAAAMRFRAQLGGFVDGHCPDRDLDAGIRLGEHGGAPRRLSRAGGARARRPFGLARPLGTSPHLPILGSLPNRSPVPT